MQSSSSPAEGLARRKLCPTLTLSQAVVSYGVGAGDSAGDGEGASLAEPSVFGGFLFADLCRVRGAGVGDAAVTAGAVVVPVVPCCWQEVVSTMPSMAAIKHNVYLFIGFSFSSTPAECLVA